MLAFRFERYKETRSMPETVPRLARVVVDFCTLSVVGYQHLREGYPRDGPDAYHEDWFEPDTLD
jgi:hypothetical protein